MFRWQQDSVEIENKVAQRSTLSTSEDAWIWQGDDGVEVRLDRIRMQRARRGTGEAWGDVALLVLMLTLTVGVAQLNAILRMVVGEPVESGVLPI